MKTFNIIILLVLFVLRANAFTLGDSLGIKKENGVTVIMHRVSQDETLYSLCKRYKCSQTDVYSLNPEMGGKPNLLISQVLKFPFHGVEPKTQAGFHVIEEGETIFSISRQYNIKTDDLKRWNSLQDNKIIVGQKLVLHGNKSVLPPKDDPTGIFVVPNAPSGTKIEEKGIAKLIASNRRSTKHLALHRDAPVGTLLAIRNEASNKQVVVKVIGKLPDTGENSNVLVRLSPAAYYKLGPNDSQLLANVTYVLPPSTR